VPGALKMNNFDKYFSYSSVVKRKISAELNQNKRK